MTGFTCLGALARLNLQACESFMGGGVGFKSLDGESRAQALGWARFHVAQPGWLVAFSKRFTGAGGEGFAFQGSVAH